MTKYGVWDPKLAAVGGDELFSAGLKQRAVGQNDKI